MTILQPILNPQQFESIGLTVPAGVLLFGPPGCGQKNKHTDAIRTLLAIRRPSIAPVPTHCAPRAPLSHMVACCFFFPLPPFLFYRSRRQNSGRQGHRQRERREFPVDQGARTAQPIRRPVGARRAKGVPARARIGSMRSDDTRRSSEAHEQPVGAWMRTARCLPTVCLCVSYCFSFLLFVVVVVVV